MSEPTAPQNDGKLTPTEASVMTLCAIFAGMSQAIEVWTLQAVTLEVPLEKIQEAGKIGDSLRAWCEKNGPWEFFRRPADFSDPTP